MVYHVHQILHRLPRAMGRLPPVAEGGGDHGESHGRQAGGYGGVGIPIPPGEYSAMHEEDGRLDLRRRLPDGGGGHVGLYGDGELISGDGARDRRVGDQYLDVVGWSGLLRLGGFVARLIPRRHGQFLDAILRGMEGTVVVFAVVFRRGGRSVVADDYGGGEDAKRRDGEEEEECAADDAAHLTSELRYGFCLEARAGSFFQRLRAKGTVSIVVLKVSFFRPDPDLIACFYQART